MRLGLLWVGRTRDGNIRAAIEGYVERIGKYTPTRVIEVKEETAHDKHAEAAALEKEGERIREKIPRDHEVVLLDPRGRELSSVQFAGFLDRRLGASSSSMKGLTFVVGGHLGVDARTRRLARHTISLSRMTLTHEMARLVAVEQIYRGLCILRGAPYHR